MDGSCSGAAQIELRTHRLDWQSENQFAITHIVMSALLLLTVCSVFFLQPKAVCLGIPLPLYCKYFVFVVVILTLMFRLLLL